MSDVMVEATRGPSNAYGEHGNLASQSLENLTVTSQLDFPRTEQFGLLGLPISLQNFCSEGSQQLVRGGMPKEFLLRTEGRAR